MAARARGAQRTGGVDLCTCNWLEMWPLEMTQLRCHHCTRALIIAIFARLGSREDLESR